jgi:hypothetical protein
MARSSSAAHTKDFHTGMTMSRQRTYKHEHISENDVTPEVKRAQEAEWDREPHRRPYTPSSGNGAKPQENKSEQDGNAPPRTTSGGNVLHRTEGQKQADQKTADKYCDEQGNPRDPKAVIAEVKRLNELDYEKERKAAASSLDIRFSTLDRIYRSSRPASSFTLSDPEPWPDAVDGAELLDEIRKATSSHLILPDLADVAISLWVVLAHCHDAFRISPLLSITSPEPCGKTQLLRLLKGLVPKPLSASNVTPSGLSSSGIRPCSSMSSTLMATR